MYQPGNSPGRATAGTATISGPAGGGTSNFAFQINNATGTAGPIPDGSNQVSGWSLLVVQKKTDGPPPGQSTGNLTWAATAADKLTINLQTLVNPTTVGNDIAGQMANFDSSQPYRWLFLQQVNATTPGGSLGTYTGPTDNATLTGSVNFVTTSSIPFANATNGGTFGIQFEDHSSDTIATRDFYVGFTPVPEPATLLGFAGLTLAGAGWVRQRRNRT